MQVRNVLAWFAIKNAAKLRSELADFKNQFALQMTRFADPVRPAASASLYRTIVGGRTARQEEPAFARDEHDRE
jgi:hypothetical protein